MNKFTRLFIDESRVYIPDIAAILRRLVAGAPRELDVRNGQLFSHSVKGMALYEEQPGIAALASAMERGFERLSHEGANGALLVGLATAVPLLARMIDEVEEHGAPQADPAGLVATLESNLCMEES